MNKIGSKERSWGVDKSALKLAYSGGWQPLWPPSPMINWDYFLFPFKSFHGWAESSEVVFGRTLSASSPQIAGILIKGNFLLYQHFMSIDFVSGEQRDQFDNIRWNHPCQWFSRMVPTPARSASPHLGTSKCKLSGLAADLLSQKLWMAGPRNLCEQLILMIWERWQSCKSLGRLTSLTSRYCHMWLSYLSRSVV